jgi:hypothetical protein
MTTVTPPVRLERPQLLSLLWIFLVLNFIYCDVLGLHDGAILSDLVEGHAGPIQITTGFLLFFSFVMEIPMAMVLVARLARRPFNRIANIAAGTVMLIIQTASLFSAGLPSPSYLFFSAVEIATLAVIVVLAIRWRKVPTA